MTVKVRKMLKKARKRRRRHLRQWFKGRGLHHLHSSLEGQIEPLILTLAMFSMVSVKNRITKMSLSYIKTSFQCVGLHLSFSSVPWITRNPNFATSRFPLYHLFWKTTKTCPRTKSTWLSKTYSATILKWATSSRPTFLPMTAPRHNRSNRKDLALNSINSNKKDSCWNHRIRAVCRTF